jgi:LuxR family transcriptional regulator, maltose regulon positive regulatory protein
MRAQEFRKHVKSALEHFYDTAYLEVHPLLAHLTERQLGNRLSGAQQLRGALEAGIEALRPPPHVPASSPDWRSFHALRYRYVQGMSIAAIESELGIRTRQVQRELSKGLDALSSLLWSHRIGAPAARTAQPVQKPLAEPNPASSHASQQTEQPVAMLLDAKLATPRLPPALVVRERLLRDLDAALSRRLTVLSAAAGWGKTTLLDAWLQSVERRAQSVEQLHDAPAPRSTFYALRSAWLSLDEMDNDVTRFWVSVIAALQKGVPDVGALALAMLHAPEPPPLSASLAAILNDLGLVAERTAPLVLILDDYHVIEDPAIHEALTFFVEHLPPDVHLVLASRLDPDLPLARWRVGGHLAELRAADLRFTTAEATTFFKGALGDELAEADVRLLERRTEGWIAGLQLAALAMRQRVDRSAFVQTFSGSHRYLLDYVQQEILQRQPLRVQRFLLRTAVLSRMNAAICAALTDDTTSQMVLEMMERNNLFVVPLDEQRQWYRVHDLFREALLARLRATEPELVPRLHQRAAHWYAAHDELPEAITHALAAEDFSYAATLMERAAEQVWLTGETGTLYRWVMALPDAVVREHAHFVLTTALYLLNAVTSAVATQRVRVRTQAEQMMARVEAALRRPMDVTMLPEKETPLLEQRLRLLRGWYALFESCAKGDVDQLHSIWLQMQDLPLEDGVLWQMIPLHVMVILREWFLREGALLVPRLLEAKQRVIQAGDRFATIKVMQWLAMIYLGTGQLRQVHLECVAALDLLQQMGGHPILGGYCRFFLAQVLFQWNELDEARSTLRQMIPDAQTWQQVELQILGYLGLAEVEFHGGNLAQGQQAQQEAEQLVHYHGFPRYLSWLESLRVRCWLAEGNLAAARDWAEQVVFDPDTWNPNRVREFGQLVLVNLIQHHYTHALEVLERFRSQLDRPENIDSTIYFLSLHVLALHYSGKHEQVPAVAARLLALSQAEGYVRVYLEKATSCAGCSRAFSALRVPALPRRRSPLSESCWCCSGRRRIPLPILHNCLSRWCSRSH